MEAYSVGVQVPSLAPLPLRFVLPGLVATLSALAACAPPVETTAAACAAAIERGPTEPDPEFLDLLTPASRDLVARAARAGDWPALRRNLKALLAAAKPVPGEPGLLRRPGDGATLFFVRDGHGFRLDLVLSGGAFLELRQDEYPPPG